MELTWLADSPQSRRRTRALHACPTCRRRKVHDSLGWRSRSRTKLQQKRCCHLVAESSNTSISETKRTSLPSRLSGDSSAVVSADKLRRTLSSSPDISQIERFVGDLNPEAAIREKVDAPNGALHRDRVGLWISNHGVNSNGSSNATSVGTTVPETQPVASLLYRRYSSALKACDRLPRSTTEPLAAIYFSRVNHILPLVDHELFAAESSKGTASVLLERAICLVAAKDKTAGPHLRLTAGGALITARKFCSEVYGGLVCAMEAVLERDRPTRIRILALMSLHSEGYEGAEAASMHLCQAIHQAQTAGLHLERPDRSPDDSLATLFWCLWSLDKMHASIGGRPVLLADRDIGIKRHDGAVHHSKSAFDAWLALSELLSTVISFYRPTADDTTGWETEYPSFEEIIGNPIQEQMDFATLSVLELYYHAISILSCRYRSSQRFSGSRPSHTRQGLAAVRINSLVGSECAQGMPPLPVIPYAVSLSMGVSYQELRSSKLITHFNRARASLETCCSILEELVSWCSAEAMARLGRKALRQIDGLSFENNMLLVAVNSGGKSPNRNTASAADLGISGNSMPPSPYSFDTHHPSSDNLPTVMDPEQHAIPLVDEQQDYLQDPTRTDGFANIDMLFDDFLDLSLPTNFWDPIFFPSEQSNDV
ncbi:hypothetical protein BDV10DRAFT_76269 [Aspergillus recurvatus]